MRGNKLIIRELEENSGWCDKDMVMFYGCFQLLEDYVNEEMDNVNWNHPDCNLTETKKEIMELYNWYQERKKLDLDFNKQYDIDQEYFIKLINIRHYLWT